MVRLWLYLLAASLSISLPYTSGPFADFVITIPGGGVVTPLDILCAAAGIYLALTRQGRSTRVENWIYISLGAVLLSRVISLVWAPQFSLALVFSTLRYPQTLALIYVTSRSVDRPGREKVLLKALTVVALTEAIGDIIANLATGERGIFLSLLNLRWMGLVVVTVILESLARRFRLKHLLVLLIILAGFVANQTRSAILVTAVCTAVVVLPYVANIRLSHLIPYAAGIVALCFGAVLLTPASTAVLVQRFSQMQDQSAGTTGQRLFLWSQAIGYFCQHPATGIGSGQFSRIGTFDAEVPDFMQVRLSNEEKVGLRGLSTHSTVGGVLAETGLVGFCAYALWAWASLSLCRRVTGFHISPAITALAVFAMINILADSVYAGSFENPLSCMLGILIGVVRQRATQSTIARHKAWSPHQ